MILITIAVSFLFKGIAMFTWGKDSLALPAFSGEKPILIWGAAIHPQMLWIIGFLVALVCLSDLFFQFHHVREGPPCHGYQPGSS